MRLAELLAAGVFEELGIGLVGDAAARPVRSMSDAEDGIRYEIDPDFLEYARRDAACGGVSGGISAGEQAELPWEA